MHCNKPFVKMFNLKHIHGAILEIVLYFGDMYKEKQIKIALLPVFGNIIFNPILFHLTVYGVQCLKKVD